MAKALANRVLPDPVLNGIFRILDRHNTRRADGDGTVSKKTQHDRKIIVLRSFADLWTLGYRITKPESLAKRHIDALVSYWDAKDLSASQMHTSLSVIRTFCGWIGKPEIVRDLKDYVDPDRYKRSGVAQKNHSWKANNVSTQTILKLAQERDPRLAVILGYPENVVG